VYAPAYVTLPRNRLAVSFGIMGTRPVRKGSHTITVSLTSGDGHTRTKQQQDLADGRVAILDTSTLVPGRYRLDLTIFASDGTRCAHETQPIEAVDGLLVLSHRR
jgi:methionine-rich copper-binding protein CopC